MFGFLSVRELMCGICIMKLGREGFGLIKSVDFWSFYLRRGLHQILESQFDCLEHRVEPLLMMVSDVNMSVTSATL